MCRTLGVGVSGYFAWWRRPENRYVQADVTLSASIQAIYQQSRGTYGAPRVQAVLADEGLQVSRARITRLMKAAGLRAFVIKIPRDGRAGTIRRYSVT